tara:strand:- start:15729 stop:19853 length:4125 start_codon:yes stop_codon:yes gene_type:complete
LKYTRLILILLFVNQAVSQSVDFTDTVVSITCSGTTIKFEATFTPGPTSVTEFDFNDGVLPAGWDSSPYNVGQPCNPATGDTDDNSDYFWATTLQTSGNNIGRRFVQTSAVDVSQGGNLEFYIRYGKDDPQPGCEDPERANEEVKLQYSINGGSSWITIYEDWNTVSNKSAAWYSWHSNNIDIPIGAWTNSTIFRWYQPSNDGNQWDNWGLDDIVVKAITPPSASWEAGYTGLSSDTFNVASNTVSFTKLFPPSNQDKVYSVSVSTTLTNGIIIAKTRNDVTVPASDNSIPSITTSNIVTNTLAGLCKTNVDLANPVASDNCSVAGYVGIISGYSGNLSDYEYPIGVTTITWTVSDTAGNISSTFQFITVIDNEDPVLTIPADIITSTCSVVIGVASATDNCSALTPSYTITSNGGVIGLGSNTIIWHVTDLAGRTVSKTQSIIVSDTTVPVISAPPNLENKKTDNGSCVATNLNLGIPSISDDCSAVTYVGSIDGYTGVLSDYEYPIGVTTITWTVSDTAGNISSTIQLVTIIHEQPPIITISETTKIISTCVAILEDPVITSCSSSYTISRNPSGNQFNSGITTITWTVTDTFGNTATSTQLINYISPVPGITLPANIEVEASLGSCGISNVDLSLGNAIGHISCGTNTPTNDAPEEFPVGITAVTWTVTDTQSGQTFSKVQSVTVNDVQPPIIRAIDNITLSLDQASSINLDWTLLDNGSEDNCAIRSFSIEGEAFETIDSKAFSSNFNSPPLNSSLLGDAKIEDGVLSLTLLEQNSWGVLNINPDVNPSEYFEITFKHKQSGGGSIGSPGADGMVFNFGPPLIYNSYTEFDNQIPLTGLTVLFDQYENKEIVYWKGSEIGANSTVSFNSLTEIKITYNKNGLSFSGFDLLFNNKYLSNYLISELSNWELSFAARTGTYYNYHIVDDLTLSYKSNPSTSKSRFTNREKGLSFTTFNCDNLGAQEVVYSVTDSSGNTSSKTINIIVTDDDNVCNSSDLPKVSSGGETDSGEISSGGGIDSDGDGFLDSSDAFPFDPAEWLDTDSDLIGNNKDLDDDNDGQSDLVELDCGSDPLNNLSRSNDTDFDGLPNCLDPDDDNDGFEDIAELSAGTDPLNVDEYPDDSDADGIQGPFDNCPDVPNPDQLDSDSDFFGDVCDNCPLIYNIYQEDTDQDGIGDVCDNCLENKNPLQEDYDLDGLGDLCDNCPENDNPLQEDYDKDLLGDICDLDDDNDGQSDKDEIACGSDPKDETSLSPDIDGDGILDCLDTDKDNDGIDDSVDIDPSTFDDILISQFVSDNGDGINDQLIILKIDNYPNNLLSIYSRSGALVYSKVNYQNTWPSDLADKEFPEGSYFFRLDLEQDGNVDYQGWLYLTR